jgi:dCMP deaminase
MGIAQLTAQRATCCRRSVGAVLLNARGHVLATGYNGVARGMPHCNETVSTPVYQADPRVKAVKGFWVFDGKKTKSMSAEFFTSVGNSQCVGFENTLPNACSGATSPSGANLDACQAVHAEQNALLQCSDVYAIHTVYTTTAPCITCCKLLLNTGCERVVYLEDYVQTEAKDLWLKSGRIWDRLEGSTG